MISVVIPAYNCEMTIEQCINSVLLQNYSDFEVIVVDDGSIDCTREIVQKLKKNDFRIRLICQANLGVSSARNRGVLESKGEYICFVDSDDYIAESFLKELTEMVQEGVLPVVNFAYNSNQLGVLPIKKTERIEIESNGLAEKYLIGEYGKKISFAVWNKLFSRKVLIQYNIKFYDNVSMGEDMLFVYQYLLTCTEIRISNKTLYHYTIRPESAVNNSISDFAPKYETLFKALCTLNKEGNYLTRDILARWVLEILPYCIARKYVYEKKYRDFKSYFYELKRYEFIQAAQENKKACGMKKRCLQVTLKMNTPFFFYSLLKFYKLYFAVRKLGRRESS